MQPWPHCRRRVRRWLCRCGLSWRSDAHLYLVDQDSRRIHPGGEAMAALCAWSEFRPTALGSPLAPTWSHSWEQAPVPASDPRVLALDEAEETLRVHRADEDGDCRLCGETWPCHAVVIAERVREALAQRSAHRR